MEGRWEQIERIFHEASELQAGAQSAFLDRACSSDNELRAEVESLLAADAHGARVFGEAVGRVVESMPDDGSMEGHAVGPYTIEREIGRGGMGAVYLAHRHGDFSKRVAIKLVKRGMDTEQIVRRFHQERQILANLEHPNIARLLDGGATEDGRPYLVMEYVEGKPITPYCAEAGLSVRAKLALFLQVCEGVLCAHRNLAIHRDLKPGNILVNADGVVKLLDFGIAKLLDPNGDGETAQRTMAGTPLLTPDYASPEQVRGAAVSVSTDVYSLGAVLYELLCARTPHRFEALSAAEIERVICEGSVAPMGTGSRELESIVAMALRKEPERRYPSVEQLAEDVRRYLDGRPVMAVPDSRMYRASRWVRRNRTAAIAAGVAIVGLLSGLGVALYQAQVARAHAARAERRFGEVRKLAKAILFEHYDLIRTLPGSTKAKESMARVSQEYLDSLVGQASDPELAWELASAYNRLAGVQGAPGRANLGQVPQAIGNFRKAVGLLDGLPAHYWNMPDVLNLALGALHQLSRTLAYDGRLAEAEAIALRLPELARKHYALRPDEKSARQLPQVYRHLSLLAMRRGDVDGAALHGRKAVELALQVGGPDPPPLVVSEQAAACRELGEVLFERGDLEEARENFERNVRIFGKLSSQFPLDVYFADAMHHGHYLLADLQSSFQRLHLGDGEAAERHCGVFLRWAEERSKDEGEDAQARQNLAHGHRCLGTAKAMRRPADGLAHLRQSVRYAEEGLRRSPSLLSRMSAAFSLLVLADTEAAAGLRGDAVVSFRKGLRLYDALEKESLSPHERTDVMLANRQYARWSGDVDRARKAVAMTRGDGRLQEVVHAAEAREVLAEVSPADRCGALREAAALWEKVRAHPVAAELAGRRLQAIRASTCGKP